MQNLETLYICIICVSFISFSFLIFCVFSLGFILLRIYFIKGVGGVKSEKKNLLLIWWRTSRSSQCFLPDQKILIFNEDVPKKLVFYTCESRLSRRFSRNRVFLPILLEFSRYLLPVFYVMKVLILQKKSMESIFDFLILWFL